MQIRSRLAQDNSRLLDIWLAAVRASHDFLTPADIDRLEPLVRDLYLPAVEVWVAETDRLHGFIGLDGAKVEMLFIHPDCHGRGYGRRLLEHAEKLKGPLSVDVNEQNPAALAFYRQVGFRPVGRSPLDGQGQPFPLIHLER